MKNLQPLLEYQKIDIQLRKELNEIEQHELQEKLKQAKEQFETAKNNVVKSEQDAGSLLEFFEKAEKMLGEHSSKIDAANKKLPKIAEDDIEMRGEAISALEGMISKLSELDKKMFDAKRKSEHVIDNYKSSSDRGKKLKDFHANAKGKLDEFVSKKAPKINDYKKSLAEIKEKINPKLFASYSDLTSKRKYPAIVEAKTSDSGKTYNCTGCGMSMSNATRGALLESEITNCENCKRIVYLTK
ncbi:MAG: hypothetical protein FWC11_01350 [Firmicutes bacterium]|nr:hypothetical protein [Bacillota bacterium]MCL2255487.1 hypothetical protein [Bacillota bacterium]